MIRELALVNFRGVKKGLVKLFPMTVLLGANNSGKTTVIEALHLIYPPSPACLSTYRVPNLTLSVAEVIHAYHRTLDSKGYRFLVHNYDGEAMLACRMDDKFKGLILRAEGSFVRAYGPLEAALKPYHNIMAFISDMKAVGTSIDLDDSGRVGLRTRKPSGCLFVKPHIADLALAYVREKWGLIRGRGLTGKVASELSKLVNEEYDDLTLEPHIGGGLSLNAILKGSKIGIRLGDMGDGMRMLALAMLLWELSGAKLLLWDDVEAFMNPSTLIYISQWMAELVEQGAQVVVATHSREAAKLIAGAAEEAGQEARIVLLALRNGVLEHKALSLDDVEALEQAGVDVRMAEGLII